MIRNLWKNVHFICGCHGNEKPVYMIFHEGAENQRFGAGTLSGFYSCPKYYPENRNPGENACFNRMTVEDCQDFIEHLSKVLESGTGVFVNPQGFAWTSDDGVEFTVTGQTNNGYYVSVVNHRALMRGDKK